MACGRVLGWCGGLAVSEGMGMGRLVFWIVNMAQWGPRRRLRRLTWQAKQQVRGGYHESKCARNSEGTHLEVLVGEGSPCGGGLGGNLADTFNNVRRVIVLPSMSAQSTAALWLVFIEV